MCGVSRLLTALVLVVAIGVADMVDGGASVAVVVSGAVQMDYQERLRGLLPVTCNRRVSFALVLGSASEHVCVCVCVCVACSPGGAPGARTGARRRLFRAMMSHTLSPPTGGTSAKRLWRKLSETTRASGLVCTRARLATTAPYLPLRCAVERGGMF